MSERVIGLDYGGIIANNFGAIYEAYKTRCEEEGISFLSEVELKSVFPPKDWEDFFERAGIPKNLRGTWNKKLRAIVGEYPLVPGAIDFINYLKEKYDKIYVISTDGENIVRRFLEKKGISGLGLFCDRVDKSKKLEDLGITDYVGDSVSDGEACIEAKNKPRFYAIVHDYGWGLRENLSSFKDQQLEEDKERIVIVSSLDELKNYL